jgi:hypothetical protein
LPDNAPFTLPRHHSEPWTEDLFVVMVYEAKPGWWRRDASYRDYRTAQQVADAHNDAGKPVMVCRQRVWHGPLEPLVGQSGSTSQSTDSDAQPGESERG